MHTSFHNLLKLNKIHPNILSDSNLKLVTLKKCLQLGSTFLTAARNYSASQSSRMKVTVIGAAGKIGQPLCLMLKQSPLIEELCLHDMVPTTGFAAELNYIDTDCKVTAFTGKDNVEAALTDSKIVVVLASALDADFMQLNKMWSQNAQIVYDIVQHFVRSSPKAFLALGTNPLNSTLPLACEVLKKGGCFNPNAVFGMTTLNSVRANTFAAQVLGVEPESVLVPVIGGHTEETIVPVLSNTKPCAEFTNEELESITTNVKRAQENMLKLKHPETAPLSSAFACARFVLSLVKAIHGYPDIIECAYVPSKAHPQVKYLATPLLIGPNGVVKNLGIPKLSEFERCMLDNAIPSLVADTRRGETFVGVIDPPLNDPADHNVSAPRCPRNWSEYRKERDRV